MEFANEIIKQVVPVLMVPINRYLRYLTLCTMYMREMDIKMTELNDAKVSVEEKRRQNIGNNLEVPAQVEGWLEAVGNIREKVEKLPRDIGSCYNLKIRLKAGRNAFEINEEIDSVMRRCKEINWADHPIPLGRVDSLKESSSAPSTKHNDFKSREVTFTKALKALEPNNKSHMIALCGMGGVGKTTLMRRLKEVVQEKKMFNFIVEAVIGEKTDPIAIQDAIAEFLGVELNEKTKLGRAEKLRQGFKPDGGKNKYLVILDDVWQSVNLEDIGLSPLPNQGVNFKVLLTSRNNDVCAEMGVEADLILIVGLLIEEEAQSLFWQFAKNSDLELHKIGDDIVRKCCGLPIAIKTMACSLRTKSKDAWKDALSRLEHHGIDNIPSKVFETSYDNLQDEETKSIFLLCGLFPEDLNIPTEELVRYGWGLKLFNKVFTISEARTRLNTCIERLIHTNLLMESNVDGCVKMHDLVLAFVLNMFLKVEQASIVNHGSMPGWPENDENNSSCKRISLTCMNMSEFPKDLKFPNLSILKLMHGGKSLRFPREFYREMEKLHVIAYDKMKYPLLPLSSHCLTNIRVLHLHECSLMMFDCSSIGNLFNIEVLSFVKSDIEWLPSTIGKLKNLRLLDLTDCTSLRIDNNVLRNLVKLEELYMGVTHGLYGKAISLTDANYNEMAERLETLSALELQFFENNPQLKNMSFQKLQRFKISMGCYLSGDFSSKSRYSFENRLQLDTNKSELLESRINELFEKTEVLILSVGDMDDLGELTEVISISRPPQSLSFYVLRVLAITRCAELRYLFTPGVANTLSKLEHLYVDQCHNLKELIHTRGSEEETIIFPNLKSLNLCELPQFLGFCCNVNIIKLPELVKLSLEAIPGFTSIYAKKKLETSSLLKEKVVIPKLKELYLDYLESLEEIWPCEFSTSDEVKLRVIEVINCNNLVTIFPCNPMSLLHHLQYLLVENCGSVEVLFNIDLESVGEIGEGSSLRSIKLERLWKLREVWRIKGADNSRLIGGFQDVEIIDIKICERLRNVFTPVTANFDLGSLIELSISDCQNQEEQEETGIISKKKLSQVIDWTPKVVLPFSLTQYSFHNLRKLDMRRCKGVEVVFDINSPTSTELVTTQGNKKRLLPCLEELSLENIDNMSHVWKCNWDIFLILQKQLLESTFHNLTTIYLTYCNNVKYLFSPLMAELLSNLKKIWISNCDSIEEVVSNRDDRDDGKTTFTSTSSHTTTTLFPHLDSLFLYDLQSLKCIGGGRGSAGGGNNEIYLNNATAGGAPVDQFMFSQVGGVPWSLCQYFREISINWCSELSSVIPCYAAGQTQKLQVLKITNLSGLMEVFETDQGVSNYSKNKSGSGSEEGSGIPRLKNVIMLPNLKILEIKSCKRLEHVFTFSALESLRQLQELSIYGCKAMKVIVKKEEEEDDDGGQTRTKGSKSSKDVVVFPRLKSITLKSLEELEGFFLGKNHEFRWPLLDYVMIKDCPKMMVFAPGGSTAPQLKYIHTDLGKHSLGECGLSFHQNPLFPRSYLATSEGMPWSFHNLIELHVNFNHDIENVIPSSELLQLEKIHVCGCHKVKEVFKALEANDESQTTTLVRLPNLTQVKLELLNSLRDIWKSNQWTVFEFPNLTTVHIESCDRLEYVFSSSMVGSLLQLQELCIKECMNVKEVIVKNTDVEELEEESDAKIKEIVVLHRLKSLTLDRLPSLKGFCLDQKVDFSFPLLDTLIIKDSPAITIFTKGNSATPELTEIETTFSSIYAAGEHINSIINIKKQEFERYSWMKK